MRRVELTDQADGVMEALPDDAHEMVLAIIDAVADTPVAQPGEAVTVFGASSWVTCTVGSDVVEVLDIGWM